MCNDCKDVLQKRCTVQVVGASRTSRHRLSQESLNEILSRCQEPVTSCSISGFQVEHSEAKRYPLMGTSCVVEKHRSTPETWSEESSAAAKPLAPEIELALVFFNTSSGYCVSAVRNERQSNSSSVSLHWLHGCGWIIASWLVIKEEKKKSVVKLRS